HALLQHGLAQHQSAGHVVVVVLEWMGNRFAHGLERREVNYRLDRVLPEHHFHRRPVQQIHSLEVKGFPRQFLDPGEHRRLTVAEVVEHHHLVTGLQELDYGVTPDETGAAGDEDTHVTPGSGERES